MDISDGQPSESDGYDEIMSLLENIDGLSVSCLTLQYPSILIQSFLSAIQLDLFCKRHKQGS